MPDILSPEDNLRFQYISIGIGGLSVDFPTQIADISFGFGPLTKYSNQIGCIGITPEMILWGSNKAITKLNPVKPSLGIYSFSRTNIIQQMSGSSSARLADFMHKNISPMGSETYNTLEALQQGMLRRMNSL